MLMLLLLSRHVMWVGWVSEHWIGTWYNMLSVLLVQISVQYMPRE